MEDRELGTTAEVSRERKRKCMTEEERAYIERHLARYTYAVDSLIGELKELTTWSKELHEWGTKMLEARKSNV